MSIRWINDWQYLFNDNAIGGRFSAFSFVYIGWLKTGLDTEDLKIDGFTFVILGLGFSIKGSAPTTKEEETDE